MYVCADLVEVRVRRQESRKFACRAARTGALRVLGSKNGVAYAAACGEAVRPRVVVSDLMMDRGCAAALAADAGLRRVTLQEGLRVIGARCFKGGGVLAVRLPASVRASYRLVTAYHPCKMTDVGDMAFVAMQSFQSIFAPTIGIVGSQFGRHDGVNKTLNIA